MDIREIENTEGLEAGESPGRVCKLRVSRSRYSSGWSSSTKRTSGGYRMVVVARHDRIHNFVDTNNSKRLVRVFAGWGVFVLVRGSKLTIRKDNKSSHSRFLS